MKIISITDHSPIIRRILKYLGLWDIKIHGPPIPEPIELSELAYLPVRARTQTGDDSFLPR